MCCECPLLGNDSILTHTQEKSVIFVMLRFFKTVIQCLRVFFIHQVLTFLSETLFFSVFNSYL